MNEDQKERQRQYLREWHKKNPGYRKERYKKNREKILAQNKEWRQRNREGLAAKQRTNIIGRRESHRRWRERNREHVRARYREYVEKNRGVISKMNRRFRLGRYGLTEKDYERMVKKQKGCCAICDRQILVVGKLVVDHDHDNRMVRELLCHSCNRALGLFGDDPMIVASAARYLRYWRKKHEKEA